MICDICGRQDSECKIKTIKGINLCPKHLTQYYRHRSFNDNTIYSPNEYVIYEDRAEIILKDKECNECGRAIIDLSDVENANNTNGICVNQKVIHVM